MQDPPLSKVLSLSRMLGISVEDVARGLGLAGVVVEPTIEGTLPKVPLGTMSMSSPKPGVTRIEMRKDFSLGAAQEIVRVMATDTLPE